MVLILVNLDPRYGLHLDRPSSWPNMTLMSALIWPFQFDFDVGPNMALILANLDPNMAFILTQDGCPKPY